MTKDTQCLESIPTLTHTHLHPRMFTPTHQHTRTQDKRGRETELGSPEQTII